MRNDDSMSVGSLLCGTDVAETRLELNDYCLTYA